MILDWSRTGARGECEQNRNAFSVVYQKSKLGAECKADKQEEIERETSNLHVENPWAIGEKNHDLPLEGFTNPLACNSPKYQTVTKLQIP